MDSQKQLKLCRFPQRTCKLMRLKVVIWILIAARSWQWAVVARNKQDFTFISFNAGTVKEYTVTWIKFILPPWRGSIIRYGRNREFTLILSVNSRLFNAWIYAYSMRECTLVQSVNYHLYGCEVMSEDSEDLAFLNHVISRGQNISCNHSPLPRPGCD